MNNLVEIINEEVVTTSKQVAEVFGKRHTHVLRDIENIMKNDSTQNWAQYFIEDKYRDASGKQNKIFIMNRDGFTLLAMGFTGSKAMEFKLQYIEAFNRMEAELKSNNQFGDFAKLPLDQQLLQIAGVQSQRLDDIEARVNDIEDNRRIDSDESKAIGSAVGARVRATVRNNGWDYNTVCGRLFKELNSSINRTFDAANRGMLKAKDFKDVLDFINSWEPSSETRFKFRQMDLLEG